MITGNRQTCSLDLRILACNCGFCSPQTRPDYSSRFLIDRDVSPDLLPRRPIRYESRHLTTALFLPSDPSPTSLPPLEDCQYQRLYTSLRLPKMVYPPRWVSLRDLSRNLSLKLTMTDLALVIAFPTTYLLGSAFPPQIVLMLYPRYSHPPPVKESTRGKALMSDTEREMQKLFVVAQLRAREGWYETSTFGRAHQALRTGG